MRLTAKTIRILHAKFQCKILTTVQDIQDYAIILFLGHSVEHRTMQNLIRKQRLQKARRNSSTLEHFSARGMLWSFTSVLPWSYYNKAGFKPKI